MIATTEALDLGQVLLDLLVIVVAARFAAELAERIKVPAVLGEIVAGILIGPSVLKWIDPSKTDTGSMLVLLGEVGVLLLLLQVGMEMDLAELGKVGKAALLVAVVGVVIPFAGGALGAWGMGEAGKTAIFLGAALTATSVGITARVLGDLKALATTEARVVLGAAVADDVLGLVILTVVVKVVTDGSVSAGTVGSTVGMALAFLAFTGLVGVYVVPRMLDLVAKYFRGGGALLVAAFALMLAFAELADAAKLAFIIGAFMAGLGLGRSQHSHRIEDGIVPLARIFVPVFFVGIGVNADLEAMARPSVLGLAAVLTVIGVVGKVIAGWAAVGTSSDRLLVGIGMIPRGEVGLIFASIGLTRGVLDSDLYGALLIMVLVTTIISPPLLKWRIQSSGLDLTGGAGAATAVDSLRALLAGDSSARRALEESPTLDEELPEVAEALRLSRDDTGGTGPGHALRLPTVDALAGESGTDHELAMKAALVLDVSEAIPDSDERGTDEALTARLAEGPDIEDVLTLVRGVRVLNSIVEASDGISDAEIARAAAAFADERLLRLAHRIATSCGDLHDGARAALDVLVDAAVRRI